MSFVGGVLNVCVPFLLRMHGELSFYDLIRIFVPLSDATPKRKCLEEQSMIE